jgi:hypothetical protein
VAFDAAASPADRASQIGQRLDAFRGRAMPTFHSADGTTAEAIAIPFRMSAEYEGHKDIVWQNRGALVQAAASVGIAAGGIEHLAGGRANPEQIAKVTQALIDAGRLPAVARGGETGLGARIRQMMFDHGIGLDCAGYVQQAFLFARGIGRSAAGFRSALTEDLSGLARRGFERVSVDDVRPGDLFILKPQPSLDAATHNFGHTAIVRDVHDATEGELAMLLGAGGKAAALAASGSLRAIVLDSAWGCGGDPQRGGVQQRVWFQDKASGRWLWRDEDGRSFAAPAGHPYDHPLDGVYRPRREK